MSHKATDFSAIAHFDVKTTHPTKGKYTPLPYSLRGLCIDRFKSLIRQLPDPITDPRLYTIGATPEQLLDWRYAQDIIRWQLCQYLKYNVPSRITEAIESLRWLIENNRRHERDNRGHPERPQNPSADGLIYLYLATALSKLGQDAEAVESFKLGLKKSYRYNKVGPRDLIWAHANYSRLLRRIGKPEKADEHEEKVVSLIRGPSIGMAPSLVRTLVLDEGETTNSIIHRIGPAYFEVTEIHTLDPVSGQDLVTMIRPNFYMQNLSKEVSSTPEGVRMLRETSVEILKPNECWIADCKVTENLRICKACKRAMYCGVEHQNVAWKAVHKKTCKELQKF